MESVRLTDEQSRAVQKTPNRVSLDDIERNIACEFTARASDIADLNNAPYHPSLGLLTIHVIVLQNGFTVIGKTAPADAANFDADLGRKFAREDAIRQIWPLMGYALREKIDVRDRLLADAAQRRSDLFGEGPGAGIGREVEAAEHRVQLDDGARAPAETVTEVTAPAEPAAPTPSEPPTQDEAAATQVAARPADVDGGRGSSGDAAVVTNGPQPEGQTV